MSGTRGKEGGRKGAQDFNYGCQHVSLIVGSRPPSSHFDSAFSPLFLQELQMATDVVAR